nr:hypothetical protein [Tanacetum cinerariifolium]
MLKVDVKPIAPRLLNNKTVHSDYLRLTHEQATILREVVEQWKSKNPLNNSLDHACCSNCSLVLGLRLLKAHDQRSLLAEVKCLRSKDEAPHFIIKFLTMIQVRLKTHVCRIRIDNGTEFVNQTLREYYKKFSISHETSVARSPHQNGIVERRNRVLIEAVHTMLIYTKAPLFLWAEEVATICYKQNRSIIRLRHGKTPYELLHNKPHDLSFLYVFDVLCYLTNNSENLGKLQPKADIDFDELTDMASEHSSLEPALHEMTPTTICSGLVSNPPPSTPFLPPLRTDWDLLFQPLFGELLTPSPSVDFMAPEVIAPIAKIVAPELAASTGLPSSTTVDKDAPSPSVVCELLGDGASLSTVVDEGKPIDAAGSGATILAIGAMTSGAIKSTLDNKVHQTHEETIGHEVCYVEAHMVFFRDEDEKNRSQNHSYKSFTHRSPGHRPNGTHMRPPHRSLGLRPHRDSMRPTFRPAGHRPHGPSINPWRPIMNGARPYKSFFQAPLNETRHFLKSSAVKNQYRAPWVPTVNRYVLPVNRKFSTGRRNFPTANRKFSTASRKFTTGSTKNHTANMGRKGKAVKPSSCWTWNPSQELSNKGPNNNSVSVMFKKYTYIDTQVPKTTLMTKVIGTVAALGT